MCKLLLALLLATAATAATAQQTVRVGLKAGPTLSNFTGKDLTSHYRLAAHGGLVVAAPLSELLTIQPELLFSMKGDRGRNLTVDTHTNLSYLDVPVLLKVKAGGLFFEAGPQLGVLLSAKYEADQLSLKVNDYYHTLDIGYAVGLGFQVESGFNVGVRYNAGFADPTKGYPISPGPGYSARGHNSVFQAYVGYLLPGI